MVFKSFFRCMLVERDRNKGAFRANEFEYLSFFDLIAFKIEYLSDGTSLLYIFQI